MDLPILAIWSEAKVSEDHVAGTKVKRVSSAQPVGSVLTAWISYQTSLTGDAQWVSGKLNIIETPHICVRIIPGSLCPVIWGLRLPWVQGSNESRKMATETLASKLYFPNSW